MYSNGKAAIILMLFIFFGFIPKGYSRDYKIPSPPPEFFRLLAKTKIPAGDIGCGYGWN